VIARPYGDRAVLLEHAEPIRLLAPLRAQPGVLAVVPAARTVLVRFDPSRTGPERILDGLGRLAAPPPSASATEIALPVRYDGADLAAVAQETGCSVADVIARHSAAVYTVAFCGFSPGFAYLTGLDPVLHRPRLAVPRTAVPAGAVAIAGEYTGVYPRRSPGGWRLLGRTDATLWDLEREPPALLVPGTRVRFRPL
jgi:KipI family sensor histidine kinase inhibitor